MPAHPSELADGSAAADAALMARLACGEARALEPLYRRHKGGVYRFALLWSGSTATAADVTQDVFVHLLTRAGDFDPAAGALRPWLLGIARNFVRRRAGVREVALDEGDDDAVPFPERVAEATPDVLVGERQDLASLRRAIAALPLPERVFEDTPDALVGERQDLASLRRAIAALPPHYRDVLVLVELAERSYAETAAICGCELNTVRSRLSRARALLARWLAVDDGKPSTIAAGPGRKP